MDTKALVLLIELRLELSGAGVSSKEAAGVLLNSGRYTPEPKFGKPTGLMVEEIRGLWRSSEILDPVDATPFASLTSLPTINSEKLLSEE